MADEKDVYRVFLASGHELDVKCDVDLIAKLWDEDYYRTDDILIRGEQVAAVRKLKREPKTSGIPGL